MTDPKDPTQMSDAELTEEWERIDKQMRAEAASRAWEIPSAFSNQFHVNISADGLMRITFGEATTAGGVPVVWRTSVTMTEDQALQLADFLWRQSQQAAARRLGDPQTSSAEDVPGQGKPNA